MAEIEEEAVVHEQTFPLNSRRLTSSIIARVAAALEVPAGGSLEDTRRMLEGKLVEAGREPRNVQVILSEEEDVPAIRLEDGEGVFLEVPHATGDDAEEDGAAEVGVVTEASESGGARGEETDHIARVAELETELRRANAQMEDIKKEVSDVQEQLAREREQLASEKVKYNKLWKNYCERLSRDDELIAMKEGEVEDLRRRLAEYESHSPTPTPPSRVDPRPLGSAVKLRLSPPHTSPPSRRGKAPPIDTFSGEANLEDWLPSLQRSATWNAWSDDETLLQLAGHLRGRALEEWNLMDSSEKTEFAKAVDALKRRLDPGSKMLAIQDFRHASQGERESIADYIRRLEKMFRTAYGRDEMSTETREVILYTQMHAGLKYSLTESPAVSGATDYKQLCLSARNEEKRLLDLEKRRRALQPQAPLVIPPSNSGENARPAIRPTGGYSPASDRRCYNCGRPGHISRECRAPRTESGGRRWNSDTNARSDTGNARSDTGNAGGTARLVTTFAGEDPPTPALDLTKSLHSCLYPSHDGNTDGVRQVWITDRGSRPRRVRVFLEGVPATGVVDSGSDLTIMGKGLLERVAAAAKLTKGRLKNIDKVPKTYDGRPFTLHGRMDLDVTFQDTTNANPCLHQAGHNGASFTL